MEDKKIITMLQEFALPDLMAINIDESYIQLKTLPFGLNHYTQLLSKKFNEENLKSILSGKLKLNDLNENLDFFHESSSDMNNLDNIFEKGNNYICKIGLKNESFPRHIKVSRSIVELILKIEERTKSKGLTYKILFMSPKKWIEIVCA